MTFVPPTTLSVRKSIFLQLRDAITRHGDQVILASVFFALFCVTCLPNFLDATLKPICRRERLKSLSHNK